MEKAASSYEKMHNLIPAQWEANSVEIKQLLDDPCIWESIPLINYVPLDNLVDQQFVRFRGMIQDMYDPEYFLEKFEIRNTGDGITTVRSGRYRDIHPCGANEEFVEDSPHNVNSERQTLYCITIPGTNSWVTKLEATKCGKILVSNKLENTPSGEKRSAEEDFQDDCSMAVDPSSSAIVSDSGESNATLPNAKRSCSELAKQKTEVTTEKSKLNLNFPLPDSEGKACIVKVYESSDQLGLNEMVEVFGFLSVDPLLGNIALEEDDVMDDEVKAHNPPPSLVPRLHAVVIKKLQHCNPLITPQTNRDDIRTSAKSVYSELRLVLTQLLLGDQLAADYLICHLISTVYIRRDVLSLGQFSLNISNVPANREYNQQLYEILSLLVTNSHFLPMSLDNLNTSAFIPKKDYVTNRLSSGILQLAANTHLVLDETALQAGQLNTTGVHNMAALRSVMSQQKLDYDFQYYPLEFHTNLPILVLSEGNSLLPCEACVALQPDPVCLNTINEIFQASKHYLQEAVLTRIRSYLTAMTNADFEMTEQITQVVQTDFVEMRKEDAKVSPSDFHALLVLGRLVSLCHGECTLTPETWKLTLEMERQRKSRCSNRRFV